MPDRIEQLERLNRLKADGALSDEEFELEKRRLLGERRGWNWIIVAAGFISGAAVLSLLLLPNRAPAPSIATNRMDSPSKIDAAPPAVAAPSPPPPLDISSRIGTANGDCQFGPDLERAFASMLHYEGTRVRPREVRFGTIRLSPSVTSSRDEGVDLPDFRQYESVVTFTQPVMWNGLQLTRLRAASGWEWGSSTMEFADSPARVRAALQRMNIRIPESGSLDLPGDECPGSIALSARGSGAALVCGGGC